ncbi:shikimate dehydrogenase [[Mycobacterium] burgundiense]|uniref:Shikimate dehydrogenase n=1 Tax=[Mycobacterium] burgundiense TaxID=3064286 RepID=A0ABM9LU80_9MYCO|nr:shikimate dehydrogenase [Mycolicibacterium sp. MU0053]CAJ1504817.1 shikimate dehydrogenase [Mycolicibacterium sp. MU0053]
MTARRAAVLGSPIAHSRSPQLHLAAYRALGLTDWSYERIECTAAELPALVGGFGPEWVGVSVTMPGKFAALEFADIRTERAALVGSANTLVRVDGGSRWRADNTDVDGVIGALEPVLSAPGGSAIVLGSGGTAPAVVAGLARLEVGEIVVAARNAERAADLLALAARLDLPARHCPLTAAALAAAAAGAAVAVSTLPAEVAADHAAALAGVPVFLDALYDPWPTPLAAAIAAAGGTVVSGLQMLLHQAYAQVEQFTGRPAPRAEMAAALA